jgi:hypothetical protein
MINVLKGYGHHVANARWYGRFSGYCGWGFHALRRVNFGCDADLTLLPKFTEQASSYLPP